MSEYKKRLSAIWCFVFNLISLLLSIITRFTHLFPFFRFRLVFLETFSKLFSCNSRLGRRIKKLNKRSWTLFAISLMKLEGRAASRRLCRDGLNHAQSWRARTITSHHIILRNIFSFFTSHRESKLIIAIHAAYFITSPHAQPASFIENSNWFHFCRSIFRVKIITCFRLSRQRRKFTQGIFTSKSVHDQLGFGGDYEMNSKASRGVEVMRENFRISEVNEWLRLGASRMFKKFKVFTSKWIFLVGK